MSSFLKSVHIWCVNTTAWTTHAATYLVKLHTVIPSSGESDSWREEEKKHQQTNKQKNTCEHLSFQKQTFPIASGFQFNTNMPNIRNTITALSQASRRQQGFAELCRTVLKSTSPYKSLLTAGKDELFNPPSYLPFPKPVIHPKQAVPAGFTDPALLPPVLPQAITPALQGVMLSAELTTLTQAAGPWIFSPGSKHRDRKDMCKRLSRENQSWTL